MRRSPGPLSFCAAPEELLQIRVFPRSRSWADAEGRVNPVGLRLSTVKTPKPITIGHLLWWGLSDPVIHHRLSSHWENGSGGPAWRRGEVDLGPALPRQRAAAGSSSCPPVEDEVSLGRRLRRVLGKGDPLSHSELGDPHFSRTFPSTTIPRKPRGIPKRNDFRAVTEERPVDVRLVSCWISSPVRLASSTAPGPRFAGASRLPQELTTLTAWLDTKAGGAGRGHVRRSAGTPREVINPLGISDWGSTGRPGVL
jgi:hypothetical protein